MRAGCTQGAGAAFWARKPQFGIPTDHPCCRASGAFLSLPPSLPSASITNGLYGHQPAPSPYNLLLNPAVNPSFQLISAAQGDTLKMKCCSYLWPRSAKKVRPKACGWKPRGGDPTPPPQALLRCFQPTAGVKTYLQASSLFLGGKMK